RRAFDLKVAQITTGLPPLPDFSGFHPAFVPFPGTPGGDMRGAFFLAYDEANCEDIPLAHCLDLVRAGRPLVATRFIVPYPPGFPILVPGQLVSPAILEFMRKVSIQEIHGYRPDLGLSVFTEAALERAGRRVGLPAREAGAPAQH